MSGPLFCYYGDDFTGSTDALDSLAGNGVTSVLFPDVPDAALLARFAECQAVGIAGESRSRGPQWMAEHLPGIFRCLRGLGAPVCQYKVCSTFDSSPEYGSIGKAIEIGREVFDAPYVPVVVAAPHLRRYVLFGNLFAAGGGEIHRIDRHPTMAHHPVTPMDESDLRRHLARQTEGRTLLVDILDIHGGTADQRLDELLRQGPQAIVFDGLDEASQREVGRLLWQRAEKPRFAVGSSGLTDALVRHWLETGLLARASRASGPEAVDRVIVVSGSCSPVTEGQIRRAEAEGFAALRIRQDGGAMEKVAEESLVALAAGRSVVLYTALGPRDCGGEVTGAELGKRLGVLLRELLARSGVRRAVIAGGDTSSHAVRQLGIDALTFAARLAPGGPLCRAHSAHPETDGLELVLKGGQLGGENFFEFVRTGKP
jgi:uncharacterized protein YgbK (DUF1537 family)